MKLSMNCILVLASIFLLVGGSLAGTQSITGSSSSVVSGAGSTFSTAATGTTYTTAVTTGPAHIINNLVIAAMVPQGSTGAASISFSNAAASKTDSNSGTGKPVYDVAADLSGDLNAAVSVTKAGANANTAMASIYSNAETNAFTAGSGVDSIDGSAGIYTGLSLSGTATGSASAIGQAHYSADASETLAGPIDTAVSGSVAGNLNIAGQTTLGSMTGNSYLEATSSSDTDGGAVAAHTSSSTMGTATNGFLSSGLTSATGSLDGSADASAITQTQATPIKGLSANSDVSSTMDFGAQSYNRNDAATGGASMTNDASATDTTHLNVYSDTMTYGTASRQNTGLKNLVYGYGDITNAIWNNAANAQDTNHPHVSISGQNGFVLDLPSLPGFRAAATLLNRKSDVATATTELTQSANYAGTKPTTSTSFSIALNGPVADSVMTDAVGGWAAVSLPVTAGDDKQTLSTSIPNWNAIKWIEGSNSNPNPGYQSISPVSFTGSGLENIPVDHASNTATSRENTYSGTTSQPS